MFLEKEEGRSGCWHGLTAGSKVGALRSFTPY